MPTRSELLSLARAQTVQKSKIFRRGRVNNTASGYVGPRARTTKESGEAQMAEFIGKITGLVEGGMKLKDKYNTEERDLGLATFKNSTPQQREAFRESIKAGKITEGESPYFREGLMRGYAEEALTKYSEDLFEKWERDGVKNNPKEGAFQEFIDKFDGEWSKNTETIPIEILSESFNPQQEGLKRQLAQKHTEYQNAEYKDRAYESAANSITVQFDLYAKELDLSVLKSPEGSLNVDIAKERYTKEQVTHISTLLNTHKKGVFKPEIIKEWRVLAQRGDPVAKRIVDIINSSKTKVKGGGGTKPPKEEITEVSTEPPPVSEVQEAVEQAESETLTNATRGKSITLERVSQESPTTELENNIETYLGENSEFNSRGGEYTRVDDPRAFIAFIVSKGKVDTASDIEMSKLFNGDYGDLGELTKDFKKFQKKRNGN